MSSEPEFQAHYLCNICNNPIYWKDAEKNRHGKWVCKKHCCVSGNEKRGKQDEEE